MFCFPSQRTSNAELSCSSPRLSHDQALWWIDHHKFIIEQTDQIPLWIICIIHYHILSYIVYIYIYIYIYIYNTTTPSRLCGELFCDVFDILPLHWRDVRSLNSSLWKTRRRLSCLATRDDDDSMSTQGCPSIINVATNYIFLLDLSSKSYILQCTKRNRHTVHALCFVVVSCRPVDLSYTSLNASDIHPIMHHFITKMCTRVYISVTKWCIVGYGTRCIVRFYENGLFTYIRQSNTTGSNEAIMRNMVKYTTWIHALKI